MAGGAAEAGRSVTSKVTAILMVFRNGNEYSLTELARLAGLPVSTAHRLAGELASRRLLERAADGGYRIGTSLRMIGSGRWDPPPLLDRAPGVMADLAGATRARVRLGVLEGGRVAYAEARPGAARVAGFCGELLPAHATALGRALLAFSPTGVVDGVVAAGLPASSAYTVTDADRLRRALSITRLTRVAVSRWELEVGVCAVAMPVFGPGGVLVAALELVVGDLRADLDGARAALAVAAGSLSRELATATAERSSAEAG